MSFIDTVFSWLPKLRKPDQTLADAQCDDAGSLKVIIAGTSVTATSWVDPQPLTPLTNKRLVASSSKKLHAAYFENTGGSARWIMFFNSTTAPTLGSEPVFAFPVAAGQGSLFELPRPRVFGVGIFWAVSSTGGSYTEDVAALFRVNVEVES